MKVTLYSTDCPKCKVLEKKLDDSGVAYETKKDIDIMLEKGFISAPMLEVDGVIMNFKEGIEWINNLEVNDA